MTFLTESRTILIIYLGLLLLESNLDSYGHDLWKIYNVINLWTMKNSLYFLFVYQYIFTLDSDWFIGGLLVE